MEDFEEEKSYEIKVTITTIHCDIQAYSKEEAIDIIKQDYLEDYGIELKDNEIEIISED